VQETAAAAIDPAHRPAARLQFFWLHVNMGAAALPANRDGWRMFAEDDGGLMTVARDVEVEASLQAQHGLEIEHSKEICLERRVPCDRICKFRRHARSTRLQKIAEFRCPRRPIFAEEGAYSTAQRLC
jgi:hypothetical protein